MLGHYSLEGWIEKKWLDDQAQRVTVNRLHSIWMPVTSEAQQGSILRPVLFNIFINAMEEMTKCTLFKFADNTKMRATVNTLEGRSLYRLEEQADKTFFPP